MTETQALLRVRLRMATLLLLSGFLIFFVRNLLMSERIPWLAIFHAFVLVGLSAAVMRLFIGTSPSLRQLRMIEVFVFGMIMVFLVSAQYQVVLARAREDDATLALAATKNNVLYVFALMAVYGVFIPNTWQRAALILVPIALAPTLVTFALFLVHPELKAVADQVMSGKQVVDNELMLLMGAGTSIFGTHLINTLRTEAFEARQIGQYRLGPRIGSGGMGEVFLAEHRLLKRPCAIKVIRPGRAADPLTLARFEREVQTMAQMSHWNTVEIYDYGRTEDGSFYYVMEYLPGLSLAEMVERYGPMPAARVIHLLRQACQALREAHQAGLIHRDLKPANIVVAHRGGLDDVVKLLDFGLVQEVSENESVPLARAGTIAGSPLYMSPEQVSGVHWPDCRSDIYSLGAVAYFLLTGHPPFEGMDAAGVMIAHARDAVAPPTEHRPDIPEDLEHVVIRCLAKDPHDRYPNVETLDQALASCQAADQWSQPQAAQWWTETGVSVTLTGTTEPSS